MTVEELIAELQAMPGKAHVFFPAYTQSPCDEVEQVGLVRSDRPGDKGSIFEEYVKLS